MAEAIKESTGGNADTRKPLLIYLHHDRSILSNIFCSQLLCAESVVNLLSANFISWAWDLTGKQQKEALVLLLAVVYMCVGGVHVRKNILCVLKTLNRNASQ